MTIQQAISPAPVRKRVTVPIAPSRAFDLFLGRMHEWWVEGHSLLQTPIREIVVEPREDGAWYEIGADGSEARWGKVLAWEPPSRALLAWQLNSEWKYDPDFITEVEVRFTPDGDGTVVDFEHRQLERFGEAAAAMRDGVDEGWGLLVGSFAEKARA